MPHKFDPRKMEHLDSEERRRHLDPEALLSYLPLKPEQSVADIGSGTGLFSLPLSRRLSRGKVYALDIADEMLERLRQKVRESQITNIELIKCGDLDFPLPKGSLDGVFLAFVLHEQEDRVLFLEKIKELLKPGAWISVVEWEKKETNGGPPMADRMDQAEIRDTAKQADLEIGLEKGLSDTHYLTLLKRSDRMGHDES